MKEKLHEERGLGAEPGQPRLATGQARPRSSARNRIIARRGAHPIAGWRP
jgi:hypothetical protein